MALSSALPSLDLEKASSSSLGDADPFDEDSKGGVPPTRQSRTIGFDNLNRSLNSRQATMMSIAGTIGTGLFLGTGYSLATGGPASLVISYSLMGALVYLVMLCLGEMAVEYPVSGSFAAYGTRFVDEGFGFITGWMLCARGAIGKANELVALKVVLEFWSDEYTWLPPIFLLVALTLVNLVHVKFYGELEYWLSLLKVVTIVVFLLVSIAVNVGGNVDHQYIGAQFWTHGEAPFVDGFAGFARLFVSAAFAYGGVESISLCAGELKNPVRNLKRIVRGVFWRILLFYVLTVILISFNVAYDTPNLSSKDAATSPFTLIFQKAGSKVAASFMNAVVVSSIVSGGNSGMYTASRALYSLALIGQAPRIFRRKTRYEVPWCALLAVSFVSLVFYAVSFLPGGAAQIWVWIQNLVGISNLILWFFIGVSSWRFHNAWLAQGRPASSLRFSNPLGRWGGPCVTVCTAFIILVQGWTSFVPFDVSSFIASYVQLPIFAALYVGWRLLKKARIIPLQELDLDTGLYVETEEDRQDDEERAAREKGKVGVLWKVWGVLA